MMKKIKRDVLVNLVGDDEGRKKKKKGRDDREQALITNQ
jgi:hypothetical protein